MKYIIQVSLLVLTTGLAGSDALACGQEPIHYKIETGTARQSADSPAPTEADVLFQKAEAKLSQGTYDPAADVLLKAAETFTKSVFRVPSLQFQKAITQRVFTGPQKGDVLTAKWSIQEKFASGTIIVTDTPYFSSYDLRLTGWNIRSQADLTAFLGSVLISGKDPIHWNTGPANPQVQSPGMTVTIPATPLIRFFRGDLFTGSAYGVVRDFAFEGVQDGPDWYLDFRIGKSFTRSTYPVPPWIPERFPPLTELVKSWGAVQIRGEVGQLVKPFEGGPDFTADRDRILIAELVRRGLSDDQLLDLLVDVQPTEDGYYRRLGAVIGGMKDAGVAPFISRLFLPTFKVYERIGPVANKSVDSLFKSAAVPHCQVAVEALALEVLKSGVFPDGPLAYLSLCSTSRETIAALRTISLPTEQLEKAREFAIREIQRHIDHPVKPRKVTR